MLSIKKMLHTLKLEKYGPWALAFIWLTWVYIDESEGEGSTSAINWVFQLIILTLTGIIFSRITTLLKKTAKHNHYRKSPGQLIALIILLVILFTVSIDFFGLSGILIASLFPIIITVSLLSNWASIHIKKLFDKIL